MQPGARLPLYIAIVVLAAACADGADAGTTTTPAPETTPRAAAETTVPTTTTAMETTTTAVDVSYRWEVGDCFTFGRFDDLPYEPFGSEPANRCEETHTHEVYFTGSFPEGEDAPYPEDTINTEIRDICTREFIEFLGVLPVQVEFDIIMYLPDDEEWASGLRYQACLVYLPAGLDTYREVTGSVGSLGTDFLLEISPGDCFAAPFVKLPTVDCAQTHSAEAIGTVTHPADMDEPFPGEDELELFAFSECTTLGADYVVESRASVPVVAFARPFSELEWSAGWRELHCMAIALAPGGDILPVRGSFADQGWTVVEGDQRA